ncbi:MAG: hypothetical protein HC844_09520 [Tabrizicola sp.]|nr:hypothetical protein [Tabrizicola sp.]
MGTFLAVLAVGLSASGPATADLLLREFAVCAGRLSALMEDQWMFDGPGSERTGAELAAMVSLITASIAPGEGRRVLAWRIDAKVAQRSLLNQARFGEDRRMAKAAAARADALTAECRAMILS